MKRTAIFRTVGAVAAAGAWLSIASAQSGIRYPNGRADELRAPPEDTRALNTVEQKLIEGVTHVLLDPASALFRRGPQIISSQRYCGMVSCSKRGQRSGLRRFLCVVGSYRRHPVVVALHSPDVQSRL